MGAHAKIYLAQIPLDDPKFKGKPKGGYISPGLLDNCFVDFQGLLQKQPSASKRVNMYRFKSCFLLYFERDYSGLWSICAGGYDLRQITKLTFSNKNEDVVHVEFGK